MVEHTVKAYDKELDTLGCRFAEMGGIAKKMEIDAMDALANADSALVHQVVGPIRSSMSCSARLRISR